MKQRSCYGVRAILCAAGAVALLPLASFGQVQHAASKAQGPVRAGLTNGPSSLKGNSGSPKEAQQLADQLSEKQKMMKAKMMNAASDKNTVGTPPSGAAPRGGGDGTDDCATGTTLVGASGTTATSTVGETNTPADSAGACVGATNVDVWFNWTAPGTGNVTFSFCAPEGGSAGYDTALAAYTNCLSLGGVSLACNDDFCGLQSSITFAATAGTSYKIRVSGFSAASGTGVMGWNQAGGGGPCMGGPANNCCANATTVFDGTTPYDATGADTDGTMTCGFNVGNDVWFKYTASGNGNLTIDSCSPNRTYDTVMSVYSGFACPPGGALGCDDDGGACPVPSAPFSGSRLQFAGVTAGQEFLIQVSAYNSAPAGISDINIVLTPPASNDECAQCDPITGNGPFNFDNSTATASGVADPSCLAFGFDTVDHDHWFCWTANCNPGDTARLETCGQTGVDTKIAVFEGGCPGAGGTIVACNDDSCGLQSRVQWNPTPGATYYIALGTYPGAAGGPGTFTINCVTIAPPACTKSGAQCQTATPNNAYNATAFLAAEDFNTTASQIDSICWSGVYFNNSAPGGNDVWEIIFYAFNANGAPDDESGPLGGIIYQDTVNMAVTSGSLGYQIFGRDVYDYVATFNTPVAVTPNQCYFVQIRNAHLGGDTFFWQTGVGNGRAYQTLDLAFGGDGNYTDYVDETVEDLTLCVSPGPLGDPLLCLPPPPPPPANDLCTAATDVSAGGTFPYTLLGATPDGTATCGASAGCNDVWYVWNATQNCNLTASTCNLTGGDTVLSWHDAPCGNEIACLDDFCGLQTQLTISATAGNSYWCRLSGFGCSEHAGDINFSCAAPLTNDDCATATSLPLPSIGVAGSTIGAGPDTVPALCGAGWNVGVWYTVTGDGNTITASLCNGTSYDSYIYAFCGPDCNNLFCVVADDDFCGFPPGYSQISWCSAPATTYYIFVTGFGNGTGNFVLDVTSDGVPCNTPPLCAPCLPSLSCESGDLLEPDTCGGADTNGGCNNPPCGAPPCYSAFTLTCNEVICGNTMALAGTRDTDWYEINSPAAGTVVVESDLPVVFFTLTAGCPPTVVEIANDDCGPGTSTALTVNAGLNYYFVSTGGAGGAGIFDGFPCAANNTYKMRFDIGQPCGGQSGACCCGSSCTNVANAGLCVSPGGGINVEFVAGGNCNPFSVTTPCCRANFNRSVIPPVISSQDIFDFLAAFFSTNANVKACADFNGNPPNAANVTSQDIFDFLAAFFRPGGCIP